LTNFGLISRNLRMFLSPGDSKLSPDCLGLQWNGHSKTFRTLTFELLGRNRAPLHFKTKRVAETAIRASWFWRRSVRFPGTGGNFPIAGTLKYLLKDLVCREMDIAKLFERSLSTFTFEPLGWNIASLHFKTEWVGETASHASWFWPALAWFPGTWGIFSNAGDYKITPNGVGLQWNGQSKTFWTLTFELLGRHRAPLHFKTERLAKTALRASWFWRSWLDFPEMKENFPVPGTLN